MCKNAQEMEDIMKNFKLTVSREFGCNSREITRQLANRLGVTMYDKELVDRAAERAGMNPDSFQDVDKGILTSEERLTSFFGYGSTTNFYSDEAIKAQISIIRDIANQQKPAIFFGRCADFILREHPNTLNLFLYAPFEARKKHVMEAYKLDGPSAERMIKRIDRQRHNYYKYVTGINRSDRNLKHIMIDVNRFGTEKTVDIIYQIVQMEFGE